MITQEGDKMKSSSKSNKTIEKLDAIVKKIFWKEIKGIVLKKDVCFINVCYIISPYDLKATAYYMIQSQKEKIYVVRPDGRFIRDAKKAFGIKEGDNLEATITRLSLFPKLFDKVKPLHLIYTPNKHKCYDGKHRYVQQLIDYKILD